MRSGLMRTEAEVLRLGSRRAHVAHEEQVGGLHLTRERATRLLAEGAEAVGRGWEPDWG